MSSMVASKRSTSIIGLPSVSPTWTWVKVSDGDGRMVALAVPVTWTGWPRIFSASASKVAL